MVSAPTVYFPWKGQRERPAGESPEGQVGVVRDVGPKALLKVG